MFWDPIYVTERHAHRGAKVEDHLRYRGQRARDSGREAEETEPRRHASFRKQIAVSESEALNEIFQVVRKKIKDNNCTRAILVGHNPSFDLSFLNACVERNNIKRNPFHPFSTFDTVTLAGLVYGQTVLSRAAIAAGLEWDEKEAHSARYDAKQTALLFCEIINKCNEYLDVP